MQMKLENHSSLYSLNLLLQAMQWRTPTVSLMLSAKQLNNVQETEVKSLHKFSLLVLIALFGNAWHPFLSQAILSSISLDFQEL